MGETLASDGAFELLAGLTARLASTARLDEIVDTVLAEIVHLGFAAVWIGVLDEPTGNILTLKEVIDGNDTTHEMPPIFMLDMRQPIGVGFRERHMINIANPDTLHIIDDDAAKVPPGQMALPRVIYEHLRGHPFACGPLLGSRDQPVGALGLSSYRGRQPIPDALFAHGLLRAFMAHLGIAMERALNLARLERLNADLVKAQAAIEGSARMKAVGELAAAVAHDLNNLSGIALLAAGSGGRSPTAAFEALPRIERANRAIGELVGRLQRVSRSAGQPSGPSDVARVQEIVDDVIAMISPILRERAIAVELALDAVPPVRADPALVHQIVVNLVLNAQDALAEVPADRRRLRLSLAAAGDDVRLRVTDTGPGIAEDVLARLFEPFVTSKRGTHVGLGLAAAHASLKHFGGRIEGRNAVHGGAVFEITFAAAPEDAAAEAPPARADVHAHARRGAILAIDDDRDILEVVQAYLAPLGFEVTTCLDADAALQLVAERHFDLLLCDVGLPRRSGLEICDTARRAGYRGKLVLMTGWDREALAADRRTRSCDLILKKPFLGPELIAAIDALLIT